MEVIFFFFHLEQCYEKTSRIVMWKLLGNRLMAEFVYFTSNQHPHTGVKSIKSEFKIMVFNIDTQKLMNYAYTCE